MRRLIRGSIWLLSTSFSYEILDTDKSLMSQEERSILMPEYYRLM